MKRKLAIIGLLFLIPAVYLYAAETAGLKIRPDAPEVYEIKKGDTLWDIAEYFFGDPFSWPDIWKKNLFIKDPHWIYPGQEITLKEFLSKISESPSEPEEQPEPAEVEEEITEAPKSSVQVKPLDPNVIRLLASPKDVYTQESFIRTGWISKRSLFPSKKITAIDGGLNEATQYDIVIVDSGSNDRVKVGDMYAVLGIGDRVKNPETGKDLGYVLSIKGLAVVTELNPENARCKIVKNFSPIEIGDMVNPFEIPSIPKFDAWIIPGTEIGGTIIAVNDPLLSIHLNDIIYINKGSEDGVRGGDRFNVYDYRAEQSDDYTDPIGEIQAVNVMKNETAAVVVSLKDPNIAVGSRIELAARCRYIEK